MSHRQKRWLLLAAIPLFVTSYTLSAVLRGSPTGPYRMNQVVRCADPPRGQEKRTTVTPPARCQSTEDLTAACERRATILRQRLPQGSVTIVQAPFVIAGDGTVEELQSIYSQLIQPAARAITAAYNLPAPSRPISVFLFRDPERYAVMAASVGSVRRTSLYGVYAPSQCTMVVNLASGEGTILHELTHALFDMETVSLPIWMHEGIASLHEESTLIDDGKNCALRPLDNWRLGVLQDALDHADLPPIATMMTEAAFRGPTEARDYAYARYVCMYLHEQELMQTFYRQWRDTAAGDPTGEQTLQRLLETRGTHEPDADFRSWLQQRLHALPQSVGGF